MLSYPTVSSELVRTLDEQLTRLGAVAHVASDRADTPVLVALSQGWTTPHPLNHPTLDSFVEAELLAARLNALQGVGDRERIAILRSMAGTGGH